MNYERIYSELILRAKRRSILKNYYAENHHIIPKSMGGTNDSWNLIKLFPEEHLVAHLLLVKIYYNHEGLLHAAFRMSNYGKLTNKEYGWLKEKYSKVVSERFSGVEPWNKGKEWSDEIKKKISVAQKKREYKMSDLQKQKQSDNWKGNNNPMKINGGHSHETKNLMSKKYKGIPLAERCSEQGTKNIIEAAKKQKGLKNPNARKIIVIDSDGNEYDYSGKFESVYEDFGVFKETLQRCFKTGKPVSKGKFKGWFAKRID